MKQLIFGTVMLALFVLTGCNDDEAPTITPELSAKVTEVGTDFLKLSVDMAKAQSGAYICQSAIAKEPTPAEILTKGTQLEGKSQEITIGQLASETNYVVYLAARNTTEVTTISLAATTQKAYIQDVVMKDGWLQYYGDFYKNNVGYYMLALSSGPISTGGLPTQVGDQALQLFIGDAIPADGDNAAITPGTYRISDGHEKGTADAYNCKYVIATKIENGAASEGYTYRFVDGTITVAHDGNKTYSFVIDGKIEQAGVEKNIRYTFKGELPFTNNDPARYNPLRSDITMVPKALSGYYSKGSVGTYGTYGLTLYNTPVDASGFVAGAGEVVALTLLSPYSDRRDISKLVGTYENVKVSEAGATYTPPVVIAGMYTSVYGMYAPQGSYYCHYNDAGQIDLIGLFVKGKTIVTSDSTNITIDGAMITPQGKTVKFNYTAPAANLTDNSQYSAPRRKELRPNYKSGNLLKAIPRQKTFTNSFHL